MKVLHVIPSLGPLRGGPSLALLTMARGLARAGIEVVIAATDDNGPHRLAVSLSEPIQQDGFTIRYFSRQSHFYTFSWPLTVWLAHHVHTFDIVHIHALFSYAALPASFFARRARVPYIVRPLGVLNRWGMQNRRPLLKRISFATIERSILANAALIHYTSEQERLEAERLAIRTPAAVIPLGVELPVAPLSINSWFDVRIPTLSDRPVVLFLSRIDPKKGLDLLLDAFKKVLTKIPRAALVVAGNANADYLAALQQRVRDLDLTRDVFWTGFLQGQEKFEALANADLFVLPSYSENYGIAVVEALGCGVPVVISDQVGLAAELSASAAGVVVPCEIEPLATAIVNVLTDTVLQDRLRSNGRKVANAKYSLPVATAHLIQTYERLVQAGSHRPQVVGRATA